MFKQDGKFKENVVRVEATKAYEGVHLKILSFLTSTLCGSELSA